MKMKNLTLTAIMVLWCFMAVLAQNPTAYPTKAEDISPLLVGEKIPALTLKDVDGKDIDLNKAIAEKPTILVFYRGGWCPFCNVQLKGLKEIESDIQSMNYQIIAISTDSPKYLSQSKEKGNLNYTLLSDNQLKATLSFGLAFKAPESYGKMLLEKSDGENKDLLLPVPAVFIVDTKGIIKFEHINPNFKERLSSTLIKSISEAMKTNP
jgi:peroxiredoxin